MNSLKHKQNNLVLYRRRMGFSQKQVARLLGQPDNPPIFPPGAQSVQFKRVNMNSEAFQKTPDQLRVLYCADSCFVPQRVIHHDQDFRQLVQSFQQFGQTAF